VCHIFPYLFICLFLTGVGKTTLTQKVCKSLSSCGVTYAGFYTQELRVQGRRIGFDVISVPDGEQKPLARV
jgi:nucleoside-triphosphatase